MTTTTHYAAIDTSYTGTIYGIGVTREAALADGAPSHDLVVCDRGPTCDDPRTGVWLRSEEE